MATRFGFDITDALRIVVVPVLSDNYAYLVIARQSIPIPLYLPGFV